MLRQLQITKSFTWGSMASQIVTFTDKPMLSPPSLLYHFDNTGFIGNNPHYWSIKKIYYSFSHIIKFNRPIFSPLNLVYQKVTQSIDQFRFIKIKLHY